jgi:protein involved in polysaccharide export with SLBB domain
LGACGAREKIVKLPPTPPPTPPVQEVAVPPSDVRQPPRTRGQIEMDLGVAPGSLEIQSEGPYRVAVGDLLSITCTTHPKFTQESAILPDGRLMLAGLGTIPAAGRTLPELEAAALELCRGIGLKNPFVSVAVKTTVKRFVTLVGIGSKSGQFEIRGSGSLLETLASAGWLPGDPRMPRVALLRQNRTTVLDLQSMDAVQLRVANIPLRPDDIVYGLPQPPFVLRGQFQQPGPAPIPPEYGSIPLEKAVVLAGGVKSDGDLAKAQIARANGQVENINLGRYLAGKRTEEIHLFPGDELFVPPTQDVGVYVFGMVLNPGLHRRAGGITLSQAIAISGHAQFGAETDNIKVVRGYPDKPEVYTVDFDALRAGDASEDVALKDGDVVYVPETAVSNVLDTIAHVLGPFTGSTSTAVQVMAARRMATGN